MTIDTIDREEILQTIDRRIGKTVRTRESIEKDSEEKTYIDGLFDAYSRIKKDISKIPSVNSVDESRGSVDERVDERVDDCISRQAVLEQTYEWSKDEFLRVTNPFDYLRKRVKSLQPVTPAEKVGHWIIKEGREQGYDIAGIKTWYIQIMCDKCGFIKTAIEGHIGQYHFCPNCGAKMVEPQESEG